MAKFAIYIESGGHYGKILNDIVEAETADQAETEFWRGGFDICDGSCFEDYDEDENDGCEPECQCSIEVEKVADDAEIERGRVFSASEYLRTQKVSLERSIEHYKITIDRAYTRIEILEKEIKEMDEELSEAIEKLKSLNE